MNFARDDSTNRSVSSDNSQLCISNWLPEDNVTVIDQVKREFAVSPTAVMDPAPRNGNASCRRSDCVNRKKLFRIAYDGL